jgi:tetratricopeptide (TPR) repeat protein
MLPNVHSDSSLFLMSRGAWVFCPLRVAGRRGRLRLRRFTPSTAAIIGGMSARASRSGDGPLTFFMAYAAPDADVAERLYGLLAVESTVFLDRRSLRLGDDWDRELAAAQRRAEITVVLVSDHTEEGFYQREEIARAIDMARQGSHRVVPLWLPGTDRHAVPYGLRIKHGLAVGDTGDLTEVARKLLEGLDSEPAAPRRAAATPSAAEAISISPPIGQLDHPVHGRDELLNSLSRALRGPYGEFHVLAGLGGVGKTTVALDLTRRAADQMPAWWVTAASPAALAAGMRLVAATLGVADSQLDRAWGGTTIGAANLLWTLLDGGHGPWLLVVDNADDPRILAPAGTRVADYTGWVRPARNGVLLVTTRDAHISTWGSRARVHDVSRLPPADAVRVLFDLTRGRGGTEAAARGLADRLGGLPLALRHAGSYLSSTAQAAPWPGLVRDFAAYASALDDAPVSLLDTSPWGVTEDERDDRRLIARTFELSLDLLTERGARYARPLLRLLSCLADAPIPYLDVLDPTHLARSPRFAEVDYDSLRRQLHELAELGLVDLHEPVGASDDTLAWTATLHPLVRATNAAHPDVRDDPRGYPALATELVSALADQPGTETDEDPHMWSRWRVLAPHAFHLLRQMDFIGGLVDTETASQACRAAMLSARCLLALGLYGQAQTELLAVLDTARRLLGPEHPDALAARHQLARVLDERGEHEQAETELTDVLDARLRVLGDDHPSTLATRNQRAWTLHGLGRDNDAEPELLTVLDVRLRILGPEHPDTLVTRMDLAEVWHAQGRLQDAETGYRMVLKARRRILGKDHPKVLNTRADLARLWREQGRLNKAEAEYHAVVTARRRILGEDHPNTLTSRHDLASVLSQRGRRQQARAEYRAVLDARRRVLGEDHPDTLATATALTTMGRQAP